MDIDPYLELDPDEEDEAVPLERGRTWRLPRVPTTRTNDVDVDAVAAAASALVAAVDPTHRHDLARTATRAIERRVAARRKDNFYSQLANLPKIFFDDDDAAPTHDDSDDEVPLSPLDDDDDASYMPPMEDEMQHRRISRFASSNLEIPGGKNNLPRFEVCCRFLTALQHADDVVPRSTFWNTEAQ